MIAFEYHAEVLARYPEMVGGVILAKGLHNGPTPEPLLAAYIAEQKATIARIGSTPLSDIDSLAGWRRVFRSFGVDPTQYRSAAEALLRRFTKKGDIPSLNLLVDLGNLVSIRFALPVAVFDTRALKGQITVRLADGSEHFTPLGESAVEHPDPGEVIFSDPTGLVIARRWCWRQSGDSASRENTTDAILTVEAQHSGGRGSIERALRDLLDLLTTYSGGTFQSAILDRDHPAL